MKNSLKGLLWGLLAAVILIALYVALINPLYFSTNNIDGPLGIVGALFLCSIMGYMIGSGIKDSK